MTEQQQYVVLESQDGFELRRYPEHVVAEVTVRGDFDEAGNRAFRPLFRYISGSNRSSQAVAMTAPVVQETSPRQKDAASEKVSMTAPVVQTEAGAGEFIVAFVLPADLTEETAPVPLDPDVRVRTVPERLAAARRYSGRWTEATFRHHSARLAEDIQRVGLVPVGPPRYARFNAPFTPWFLRRNEVVQDVRRPNGST